MLPHRPHLACWLAHFLLQELWFIIKCSVREYCIARCLISYLCPYKIGWGLVLERCLYIQPHDCSPNRGQLVTTADGFLQADLAELLRRIPFLSQPPSYARARIGTSPPRELRSRCRDWNLVPRVECNKWQAILTQGLTHWTNLSSAPSHNCHMDDFTNWKVISASVKQLVSCD